MVSPATFRKGNKDPKHLIYKSAIFLPCRSLAIPKVSVPLKKSTKYSLKSSQPRPSRAAARFTVRETTHQHPYNLLTGSSFWSFLKGSLPKHAQLWKPFPVRTVWPPSLRHWPFKGASFLYTRSLPLHPLPPRPRVTLELLGCPELRSFGEPLARIGKPTQRVGTLHHLLRPLWIKPNLLQPGEPSALADPHETQSAARLAISSTAGAPSVHVCASVGVSSALSGLGWWVWGNLGGQSLGE